MQDLSSGNLFRVMLKFSIPYLIASFLQTFYGLADLFITGQFCSVATVTAVSVGSQVMHMLTVILIGLVMGTTVSISYAVGQKRPEDVPPLIGSTILVFTCIAAVLTAALLLLVHPILAALQVPEESLSSAADYLRICFAGIPFITAYNVISGIYRGMGDTRTPMIYVAVSGVLNIGLDVLFVGPLQMGASGAASATVLAQAFSVLLAFLSFRRATGGMRLTRSDFRIRKDRILRILGIGFPVACQDGLIQVSFLVITAIADSRGVAIAAAVGVVEKIISFLFLVPSAMLSTVSAVAAQNAGAGHHERSRKTLKYGILTCVIYGAAAFLLCQVCAAPMIGPFVGHDPDVVRYGVQYLRAYSVDCVTAGIHFCFSGFFCAYQKSIYSFVHNFLSIILVRIPGAWAASMLFPETLFPMGLAAPMGSTLSILICLHLYRRHFSARAEKFQE